MAELPIACTLTRAELTSRGAGLLPGLVARATERWSIESGLRFRFEPGPPGTDAFLNQIIAGGQPLG